MPTHYYSGGFAEIVSHPSPLTYSFFEHWFTGAESIGRAMAILNLPFLTSNKPLLVFRDDELFVDLKAEEGALYKKTIFSYKSLNKSTDTPELAVDYKKLPNASCLIGTLRILLTQSRWIAKPDAETAWASSAINEMPDPSTTLSLLEIDQVLSQDIWPVVIAVGLLAEFYMKLAEKEVNDVEKIVVLHSYISQEVAKKDWFFRSIIEQEKVRSGELSFQKYLEEYGVRADNDYELSDPRWSEAPQSIKKRIETTPSRPPYRAVDASSSVKGNSVISAAIALQVLRSDAKRKALYWFYALRKAVKDSLGKQDMRNFTREEILSGNKKAKMVQGEVKAAAMSQRGNVSGKGTPVAIGKKTGIARKISDNQAEIASETIGIFPNASPYFALQYPRCIGMIFLKGGQTSHGAIVAREFRIPALIDGEAGGIEDGKRLTIDGATGEWKIDD